MVTYSSIYDQWKPFKMISKFFILQPAYQLAAGSSKVQHWWVYDPDGDGKKFASSSDFTNHPNVKWKFVTPFSTSTHRLKAKFDIADNSASTTGTKTKKLKQRFKQKQKKLNM